MTSRTAANDDIRAIELDVVRRVGHELVSARPTTSPRHRGALARSPEEPVLIPV